MCASVCVCICPNSVYAWVGDVCVKCSVKLNGMCSQNANRMASKVREERRIYDILNMYRIN